MTLVALTGVFLALFGWGGLTIVFFYFLPTLGPRWLFFFFLLTGLTGTFLPIVAFLNKRFPGKVQADSNVIMRQALWVGIYGSLITWLQFGRLLNDTLMILLAVGFGVVEFFIRMRENSKFDPGENNDE
ncbi:MAG: hypothetical protein JEZ06_17715 [Anaerolineaceae bacterium]|nr:hypothetical protein [Anaerolineaceae bacterium]